MNKEERTVSQTLEHRRSGAVELMQLSLAGALQSHERTYQASAWTMLAFGVPAMFAGPLLAAAVASGIERQLHAGALAASIDVSLPFWAWLAIASVTLLPLLFWFEARHRGRGIGEAICEQGAPAADGWRSSGGTWELRSTDTSWAALFGLLLWGPRMVMSARERLRGNVATATLADATALINYLRHF